MKKFISIFMLCLLGMFIFTACKQEEEVFEDSPQESENEKETYNLVYSCITFENPFFISLEQSLRNELEENGHVLTTLDAQSDAELQNEQIMELIEQDVDAVFISPVDWVEITPAIQALKDAGIRVINIDTQVQAFDMVDAYVGSDNENAGYLCAADLIERMPEGGKIILVECPNRNSINARIQGFETAIAKKGFEVVARIDAKSDLDVAITEVEEVLKENPDVAAIMCGDDPTALGALVAANVVARKDLIIYGIDGSPEVKKEIARENSLIVATVGQSTKKMGTEAATVAMKMLGGQSYERIIYIETFLIHKENVTEYGVDEWQ